MKFARTESCLYTWCKTLEHTAQTSSQTLQHNITWHVNVLCSCTSTEVTQAIASPPRHPPTKPQPKEWSTQDLSKVALKDAPLRSLYPDEPAPPKPVSLPASMPIVNIKFSVPVFLLCARVYVCPYYDYDSVRDCKCECVQVLTFSFWAHQCLEACLLRSLPARLSDVFKYVSW